jgi:hypothetical protein
MLTKGQSITKRLDNKGASQPAAPTAKHMDERRMDREGHDPTPVLIMTHMIKPKISNLKILVESRNIT